MNISTKSVVINTFAAKLAPHFYRNHTNVISSATDFCADSNRVYISVRAQRAIHDNWEQYLEQKLLH